MRVGIPRGLLYTRYGVAWETLLHDLGIEPVLSPPTNRAMLGMGCNLAVDENCLSVKSYLGHVAWLAERTDAVLVPRMVSARRTERECVKLWGIEDIARNALPEASIIGMSVDASGTTMERQGHLRAWYRLALELGAGKVVAARAAAKAGFALLSERVKATLIAAMEGTDHDGPVVLVVGHGYNLHDEAVGAPVLRMLERLGCRVIDAEAVPAPIARFRGRRASSTLEWSNNRKLLGAMHHLKDRVDGILCIVTFPCGPDSLVVDLATRTISGVPMTTLVFDEHSGEGGLHTRIESFVDILNMQRAQRGGEHR